MTRSKRVVKIKLTNDDLHRLLGLPREIEVIHVKENRDHDFWPPNDFDVVLESKLIPFETRPGEMIMRADFWTDEYGLKQLQVGTTTVWASREKTFTGAVAAPTIR